MDNLAGLSYRIKDYFVLKGILRLSAPNVNYGCVIHRILASPGGGRRALTIAAALWAWSAQPQSTPPCARSNWPPRPILPPRLTAAPGRVYSVHGILPRMRCAPMKLLLRILAVAACAVLLFYLVLLVTAWM